MSLTAGTRLGPYEIVAPIGAGGMGEVYRAKDTKLNRDVAIKVLPEYPGEALITVKGKPSRALGDQIRSLDKSRLRSRVETLSQDELAAVEEAVRITLALWP
jgi:serine/threonine protein kinase